MIECPSGEWETKDVPMKWRELASNFLTFFFTAFFPLVCDILFFWIDRPFFWRTNVATFCRLYGWFYSVICLHHCSNNRSIPGGWILRTAFSNILLVLALIFLKFSSAYLNTLGLLCLMALVSLRLDVGYTSDPLRSSIISSSPVSFFGEDRNKQLQDTFMHVSNLLLSKGCRLHSCNSLVEADEP